MTLYAVLSPAVCLLPTEVWEMTSLGRSQKKGMIIYYRCDCALNVQPLVPQTKAYSTRFLTHLLPLSHLAFSSTLLSSLLCICILFYLPSLCSWFCFLEVQLEDTGSRACENRLLHYGYQKVQDKKFGQKGHRPCVSFLTHYHNFLRHWI